MTTACRLPITRPAFLSRVAVLLLFTVAPHLPGYRGLRLPVGALAVALFAGCAWNAPPTTVHQPMTQRPQPTQQPVLNSGSIYQPDHARLALFSDRRARFVGDTITVMIEERTTASKKSSASATRESSIDLPSPTIAGFPGKGMQDFNISARSSTEFEGEGDAASNNLFTGSLSVTVIEVLENGNLLVSGEKQVTINRGTEFIRFSGVINPINITPTNSVSSTRVADARIEYRGTGYVAESQTMGWLSRFFMSVYPF